MNQETTSHENERVEALPDATAIDTAIPAAAMAGPKLPPYQGE
jgi:hypothetical protein